MNRRFSEAGSQVQTPQPEQYMGIGVYLPGNDKIQSRHVLAWIELSIKPSFNNYLMQEFALF